MKDLTYLENVGVRVSRPTEKLIKAGLGAVVGDNLGLHSLAEMNSVFSSGIICRICKTVYSSVCQDNLLYAGMEEGHQPELFTIPLYDGLAQGALEEGRGPNTLGIRGHCVLNSLASFHCITGMSPCLGHNFFESRMGLCVVIIH